MAHFQRLILLVILAAAASTSFAAIDQVLGFRLTNYPNMPVFPTRVALCNSDYVPPVPNFFPGGIVSKTVLGSQCLITGKRSDGSQTSFTWDTVEVLGCPANTKAEGAQCVCDTGYKEQAGQCVIDKPPTADEWCESNAVWWNSAFGGPNSRQGLVTTSLLKELGKSWETCMANEGAEPGSGAPPGCMHIFTPTMRGRKTDSDPWTYWGTSWAKWDAAGSNAGIACVPGLDDQPGDPPDVPPQKKPDEKCNGHPGEIQGVAVCIEPSSVQTEGVDWTQVTDADGNTREIKTEVKCEGEKCTVTTSNKVPGSNDPGNVTTTTTTREQYCAKNPESSVCRGATDGSGVTHNQNGRGGKGDGKGDGEGDGEGKGFCEENPDSAICKQSSFGGSCAANFSCDGDAIQCAIAKEQHKRACKLFDTPSAESQLYEATKGKDGNQTGDLPGNDSVDLSGRIDMTDALGGGSCIGDLSITVMGQSVSLPISGICPYLSILGNVLVAVSLLLALRIVGRG